MYLELAISLMHLKSRIFTKTSKCPSLNRSHGNKSRIFFFCPGKGEAVLQPTRGHAPKSNDSEKPVSSEKGRSDNFQYNFLH